MRVALMPAATALSNALQRRRIFIPAMTGVVLLVLCTLAPVLWLTHGSVPDRALNNLTSLAAFGLLAIFFSAGMGNPTLAQVVLPVKHLSMTAIVLIGCGLLISPNYKEAWKNVITGYFYHAIQTDRQKVFLDAQEHHERAAVIMPYDVALDEKIRQLFPHGVPVTLRHWLEEHPTLLHFDNEAEVRRNFLLPYYQLDSISVRPRP
jgi:hypothetical protein